MPNLVPALFLTLALCTAAVVLFGRQFRTIRWPLLAFLAAWTITTGVAASYFTTPQGLADLGAFLGSPVWQLSAVTTRAEYKILLFAPFAFVPGGALLGAYVAKRLFSLPSLAPLFRDVPLSRTVVLTLTFFAMCYCLWLLYANGSLVPDTLLDASRDYEDRMRARALLMAALRFKFYAVFYAVIPALAALCLAFAIEARRIFGLWVLGLWLNYLFFSYLSAVTYLKAPLLYMLIVLNGVIWFSRVSLLSRIVLTASLTALTIVLFFSMQVLLGGIGSATSSHDRQSQMTDPPVMQSEPGDATVQESRQGTDDHGSTPFDDGRDWLDQYRNAALHTSKAVVFRMGAAFPFYVSTFSDPAERCGVEVLPGPAPCVMEIKIFSEMYPTIDFVAGYAPAAAHVSAYGEGGMPFAVVTMVLMGCCIGGLAVLTARFSGPVGVTLTSISILFAYFLSQVGLAGAVFFYSHGVVFFLLPVGAAATASAFLRRAADGRYPFGLFANRRPGTRRGVYDRLR